MENKNWYKKGLRDGIPIGLGYFAVGFTLGIAARAIGISPVQAGLMSFFMHASAGEFAVLTIIAGEAGYLTMILTQLIVNIRYLLMSCALSQKISPDTSMGNRLLLSYFVTDEIFGLSSSVRGELNPWYNYGAATVASPGWVLGTFLGALAGNLLSPGLSSALGVALYAMFLAVVVPAARTDKAIAVVVAVSMAGSVAFTYLPGFSSLSSETRIILLTILIASLAAILRPVPSAEKETGNLTEEKQRETMAQRRKTVAAAGEEAL